MRYGIPGYRTPREMLDAEIKRILDMGVEVRLNTRVGKDVTVVELEKEFDAIFWAIGAQKGRPLPVPGWGARGLSHGRRILGRLQPRLGVLDRRADRRRRRRRHLDRRGLGRPPSRPRDDHPPARRGGPRRGRLHRPGRGRHAPARGREGDAHLAVPDRKDDSRRARARGCRCARASISRAASCRSRCWWTRMAAFAGSRCASAR